MRITPCLFSLGQLYHQIFNNSTPSAYAQSGECSKWWRRKNSNANEKRMPISSGGHECKVPPRHTKRRHATSTFVSQYGLVRHCAGSVDQRVTRRTLGLVDERAHNEEVLERLPELLAHTAVYGKVNRIAEHKKEVSEKQRNVEDVVRDELHPECVDEHM